MIQLYTRLIIYFLAYDTQPPPYPQGPSVIGQQPQPMIIVQQVALPSISSMLNVRILRTNLLFYVRQSQNVN